MGITASPVLCVLALTYSNGSFALKPTHMQNIAQDKIALRVQCRTLFFHAEYISTCALLVYGTMQRMRSFRRAVSTILIDEIEMRIEYGTISELMDYHIRACFVGVPLRLSGLVHKQILLANRKPLKT